MSKTKSIVFQLKFIDLLNKPFPNLYHEIRESGTPISVSKSDSKGLGTPISRPPSTILVVHIRHPLTKEMIKVNSYISVPTKKGRIILKAPFSIQTVKLRELAKSAGSYKRSTHKVAVGKDEYEVKTGQDLYTIAKMHDTTWQILAQLNKATIKDPDKIVPGQIIKVPPKGSSLTGKTNERPDSLKNQTNYKVKKGETLTGISQRSGVSVEQLQRMNGITNPTTLQAGQTIKLRSDGSAPTHTTPKPSSTPTARPTPKQTSKPSASDKEEGFFNNALDTMTDIAKGTAGAIGGAIGSIGDGLGALGDKAKEGLEGINDAMNGGKNDKPSGQSPASSSGSTNSTRSSSSSTSGDYTVKSGDTLGGIAQKHGIKTHDLARANGLSLESTIHPDDKLKIPKDGATNSSTNYSSQSSQPNKPVNVTTKPSNNNDGTPKEIATTNGSCICKANDLIWSDHPKVSCEFRKKVIKICQDMWPNDYLAMANNLMACMYFETATTFDPSKGNGSGYYGLIQFGTLACKDLNTTTDKIRAMSAIEQLDWVKKYFKLRNRHELIKNLVHMYLCINYPTNLIQKKTGPHDILYDYTQPAYISNPSFFKENGEKDRFKIINDKKKYLGFKDGKTYVWEVAEELNIYYKRGEKPENRKFTPTCSQVVQLPTQPADSLKLNPLACGGDKHYKRTLDNINSLHPIMRPYVIKLINEGYQKTGLNWMITDAYRSPKKQGEIPGANTNAGPMQSYHQYGLAIDIVSVTNGEITYTRDGGKSRAMNNLSITHSKKLGPIGVSLGLEWGGNWTKTKDYPHFELKPNGKTWKDLRPILINIGIENYKNLTFD